MKQHTITTYLFSELNEAAKRKALIDHSDINVDYNWWQWTYEDADNIGIKITGFDLYSKRSGIEGELTDGAKNVANKIISEHGDTCDTHKTAQSFLNDLIPLEVKQALLADDEDKYAEIEDEINELCEQFEKDILNDYHSILYNEYDHLTSDEAIGETLISNEYEFEEDGSRF